jgi:Glutathione S-transferase, N-terminal domain
MAVKLHRCPSMWAKLGSHPCWKVQSALDEAGVDYEVVRGPWPGRKKRNAVREGTGQSAYPAIEFEDGSWYREQSKDMAEAIRQGRLMEMRGVTPGATTSST